MKQITLIILLAVLATGCKKGAENPGLECGVNSHFENGACVCNTGWFGWNCERNSAIECGPHGTGYENWCNCDSGWIGADCSLPLSRLSGRYHMVGQWSSYVMTSPPTSQTGNIDTIMEVTQRHDTLYFRGDILIYDPAYGDSAVNYSFVSRYNGNNYSYLTFRKVADDSLFYSSSSGGMGGSSTTILRGVKVQ